MKKVTVSNPRKGKTLKKYSFLKPTTWNPVFVSLVSHFLFDGNLQKTWCGYNNRSRVLIDKIIYDMKICLDVNDYKIYKNNFTGVTRVAYHNVEIAIFIKQKTLELLDYILYAPDDQKLSFLSSFFDDEGSVRFRNRQRSVHGYQDSSKLLGIVKLLLKDFEIQSKIDSKYFEIIVSKRENLLKFQKLINFTPGLRVNGKRTNSIWKKDLEKRKILQMALDSYL